MLFRSSKGTPALQSARESCWFLLDSVDCFEDCRFYGQQFGRSRYKQTFLVAALLRCVLSGKVFDFSFGFQRSSAQISGEKVLIFSPCLRVSVVGFGFCLWLCYACGLRLKTFTCKLQWLAFAG